MQRPTPPTLASTPPDDDGALLGTVGVARLLKVHPKHVYRLLRRGLPAHRLGGEWRYEPREVLAWLEQGSHASDPAPSSNDPAPPLLAANGDVCVELLLKSVADSNGHSIGFVSADRTSGRKLVEAGRVVAAGIHGADAASDAGALVRVHVTRRQLGLVYRKRERPRSIASVSGVRLASRAPSAGIRGHFDAALRALGESPEQLQRRAPVFASHRDVVLAILSGQADAGIASLAWAERAGLGCLPFAEEEYDLCLRPSELSHAHGRALVRALQSRELRKALARAAGYDPTDAGRLRL